MNFLMVGVGGFFGAISRYAISRMLNPPGAEAGIPLGTFSVNLLGCFLLGLILGFVSKGALPESTLPLFAFGFLGSFTTFSAFSQESLGMLQGGRPIGALTYVFTSVILGLTLSRLGWALAS